MKKTKLIAVILASAFPFAVFADDIGSGGPDENGINNTDPVVPETSGIETESSWVDQLVEWFDTESE